jgi:hypothetical protein
MAAPPAIPAVLLAMMARGVSVIVGSRDAALRPSVMRAVGSDVADGGARVTVYLARSQARQLLQDIAGTGQLAVVFSEPASHLSVQLKAEDAVVRPATEADLPALQRYLASMRHEVQRVGFAPDFTEAMLAFRLDDLVAVSFAPRQAFQQTPGAQAGTALGDRA